MKQATISKLIRTAAIIGLLVYYWTTATANTVSKTFEFGTGTAQPHSHLRTFSIPCATEGGIAVVVKFQRLGPDDAASNVPFIVELREPDTAPNVEGPLVEAKSLVAKRAEQTIVLRSVSSNRGCSLPWRVRAKYANDGAAPVQVFGTMRIDYDGRLRWFAYDGNLGLGKGRSTTFNFGSSAGFPHGNIKYEPDFVHDVFGLPGPNPVKLKFELINPSGTVVVSKEGYADREAHRNQGLPIVKEIAFQVVNLTSGQWKLRVTNLDPNDDARITQRYSSFTPACP
jgi:hypothetical protein